MSEAQADPGMVKLGRISGLFGVQGWLKVHSDTEPRNNILNYSPWYLHCLGEWRRVEVLTGRSHNKGLLVQLANCSDRDEAAAWVGCVIAIRKQQLPVAAEGEYYWNQLVGLRVITTQGIELGRVASLMETGANDVLIVKCVDEETGKSLERLIPYIKEQVVKTVDLEAGDLVVDWDPAF